MKKLFFSIAAVTTITTGGLISYNSEGSNISSVMMENIEALANDESDLVTFGCGYSAYEWDSDWYEDTKHFTKCRKGCPEGEGTSPKYMNC